MEICFFLHMFFSPLFFYLSLMTFLSFGMKRQRDKKNGSKGMCWIFDALHGGLEMLDLMEGVKTMEVPHS